ncbi:biotin--[acetyl-CoA-carboxylase] ligase, partial [Nocardia sp. NPDC058497]
MNRAPIDAQRLDSSSAGGPLSFYERIDVVESTGSTNADLVARAADSTADRQALLAETQLHGRGRHARTWVSPPRAQIALSILVRLPHIDPPTLGWRPVLPRVPVIDPHRPAAPTPP